MPLHELLLKPMEKRIRYIRQNLAPAKPMPGRRIDHLTLDEFAEAVGANNRHRPIGWETKGEMPRDYAEAIAKLTPYPPAAVGADGAEDLFEETIGGLLRSLQEQADMTRAALIPILKALDGAGIRVQLSEEVARSLATAAPASPAGTEAL